MFDFGNANDGQRQAISTTEGPVLITAGPGTGKTYTLVQRAIYLIEERGVKPEDIFIATFTEKAAKELITRITNELASRNITVNVNEMYVGTFHSLCLRIIKDHLEYTRLKKNYRLLDTFDQQYLVFRNIYKFRTISGIENVMPKGGAWKWAQAICEFSNNLTEEIVDIDAMLSDHDMEISVIAKVVNTYQAMLDEENLIDFSAIQTECYRLLTENKDILEDLRNSIKYIMVDEYQDTNYIQEQIIFLLGTHENICVVGDDDQGLYRFRGATIRNILEFPSKFDVEKCQIIPLVINYRSDSDIVGFYNKWMITTSGSKFKFEWDKFRYDKRIVANETSKIESPCVVKLASKDDEDEWHERVLELSTKETVIDDIKNQMRYSRFSLVGEISRYMNLSCVLISRILSEAIDGFDNLVEAVNKHNEVLDDVIIPKIFNTLYEVKSEQKNEDVDVILLKEPKDSGYYEFSADENLVIEKDYNSFTPEEIKKSFHADTYCFDSKPEKECFLQYISSKKVKEIYFTGMFTANQGDLFVQYYDPESKRIRQYYPDFLAKMNDGSYQLIEVKGDNMIDDEVVKAKAEAAEEMSVASGMKYVMYASSVLMKQNVLEHPPVTYSEEPSPLLMVAEDPVPYGK